MEKKMADFFDGLADRGLWRSFEGEERERVRDCTALWNIRPGSRVLEPGCGLGRLTELLADIVGEEGEVVAVDVAPKMIAGALARGLPENVRLIHSSLGEMPGDIGTFDYVVCCNVWPHFEQPEDVLTGIRGMLNWGGHLWITHLTGRHVINAIHSRAAPEIQNHQLPPAKDLAELATIAGFDVLNFRDEDEIYWIHARKPEIEV